MTPREAKAFTGLSAIRESNAQGRDPSFVFVLLVLF